MGMNKAATTAARILVLLLLVAAILVATLVFHVQDHVGDILDWIDAHRVAGSVTFVGLYALFTGVSLCILVPLLLHSALIRDAAHTC